MSTESVNSSYSSTKETSNFAKLCRLLLDIGTDVLKELFDNLVPADQLVQYLSNCKSKLKKIPSLGGYARKKLYPTDGCPSSESFDISLFYILFRETGLVQEPPKNGWGAKLDSCDTSIAANIEMIRQFRNDLYGHAQHAGISDEEFEESWDKLASAIVSVGGTKYRDDIAKLKIASLDPESEERCKFDLVKWCFEETERLDDIENKMDYVKEMLETLRAHGGKEHLEAQLERMIAIRGKDDMKFVETKAYQIVEQNLFKNGAVMIIGDPGEGKTATAWHLILKSIVRGHELVVVESVDEWDKNWDPNKKQIFFIDDCFGKSRGIPKKAEGWQRLNERLRGCINSCDTYVVTTVRRYIFRELQEYIMRLHMFGNSVDISSQELALSPIERIHIFSRHIGNQMPDLQSLNKIAYGKTPRFPLSCRLFASDENFQQKGVKFFMNPVSQLQEELWHLSKNDEIAFSFLVLLLLSDGQINAESLYTQKKDPPQPRGIFEWVSYICCSQVPKIPWVIEKFQAVRKARKLDPNMRLQDFQNAIDNLAGTYIEVSDGGKIYRFIHESILETVGIILGKEDIKFVLEHSSVQFIQQHVRVQNYKRDTDDMVIQLKEIHYRMLAKRFTDDVINGHIDFVFQNPSVKDLAFSACWCSYISGLERSKFLQFSRTVDKRGYSLMYWGARSGNTCLVKYFLEFQEPTLDCLHGACYSGNADIVQMLIQKNVAVDIVDSGGLTPLLVACHTGHIGIVKLLLDNGADVNWEQENFGTPLHFACWNDNIELVQALLRNGAKANIVTQAGWPSIYYSGSDGNTSVLQMLLRDGKLSRMQADTNWSPLHLASGKDNLEIINLLLENGADVNLTTSRGRSPILCAAQKGNHNVVKLLIQKGADVNLADDFGLSCLHRVCYDGNTLVAKVLLSGGANASSSSITGYTPLHCASESGHVELVKLLLHHNADVTCQGLNGKRPIDVARKKNRIQIITLLEKASVGY